MTLCAGRTGQLLNHSSLAADCGISQPTAKAWFSILEASFIAFGLPAFHANLRKRLVKMPKLFFYDTGLACFLLGIREPDQIRTHPLRSALFETWIVSEIVKHRANRGARGGLSFYRDSRGTEIDLLVDDADRLTLFEAKSAATPSSTLFGGAKRVLPILAGLRGESDLVLVYGGRELQRRSDGLRVPWRMVRAAAPPRVPPTVQVSANGQPVAGAVIAAISSDKTRQSAESDQGGCAQLNLCPGHLPLTVFIARDGFAAHVEAEWVPDERALHVQLAARRGGGSQIASGLVPGVPVDLMVKGNRIAIELSAGESSVVHISGPESQGPSEPRPNDDRELVIEVVEVAGNVALLNYFAGGAGAGQFQG